VVPDEELRGPQADGVAREGEKGKTQGGQAKRRSFEYEGEGIGLAHPEALSQGGDHVETDRDARPLNRVAEGEPQ
jgi:hypothetical protein